MTENIDHGEAISDLVLTLIEPMILLKMTIDMISIRELKTLTRIIHLRAPRGKFTAWLQHSEQS